MSCFCDFDCAYRCNGNECCFDRVEWYKNSCAADPACCTDAEIDHMYEYCAVLDQEGKL